MLTDYVLLGLIMAAVIYEVWTLVNKRTSDTLSESVWRASKKQRMIPFLAGLLMGHWFLCTCATGIAP